MDTAQRRNLGISTFVSPTSLKASILQNSADAFKHRLELSNGEQFTIGMLKSAVPHCWCSNLYNRKLITKRYT
ncbi:hypothetical protein DWQ65_09340 [Treponema phagedenis]|uniref:Uncharacterized protein n=1 Tax=Treponema phagedenis TaxID=162 RepID=A0AAE6IW03_TREPH|nr:hypothetical protein FUT79_14490 [Treponema phagedenis]QEJ99304.1 hypothetical protein FUT82_15780 [Treponema phagedenis]QEK00065.1 hypothetical protein FUT84_01960 [Treponema phagedenis]QEK04875.1 hypothetical protein FUT83_14430 [Treponema phagedenis]QEK07523.1 hypothetical protein FUT80_12865 [Treponema phagedenis]